MNRKRGAMEFETIVKLIIAVVVLAIIIVGMILLKGKGEGALAFAKRLFSFG